VLGGVERLTLAIDDTPTRRYGPYVEGAGIHHNPTPGPAGAPYVYGHVFVVLGLLLTHNAWGTVALPLLSRLYVRRDPVAVCPVCDGPFRDHAFQWQHPHAAGHAYLKLGCDGRLFYDGTTKSEPNG
jgi:hypothetical protein